MGRKAKFDETHVPSGRGKKAKKQGDPVFPKGVLGITIKYKCSDMVLLLLIVISINREFILIFEIRFAKM